MLTEKMALLGWTYQLATGEGRDSTEIKKFTSFSGSPTKRGGSFKDKSGTFYSYNFDKQKHDSDRLDALVCWERNGKKKAEQTKNFISFFWQPQK